MARYLEISKDAQWTKGETYRFTYKLDRVKLFGINVPEALVPDSVRDALKRKQITQALDKVSSDPYLRVQRFEAVGDVLTIEALATQNPVPVAVIVGAIAAALLLFGIIVSLDKVEKVISSGSLELNLDADPEPEVKVPFLAIAIALAVGVFAWRAIRS